MGKLGAYTLCRSNRRFDPSEKEHYATLCLFTLYIFLLYTYQLHCYIFEQVCLAGPLLHDARAKNLLLLSGERGSEYRDSYRGMRGDYVSGSTPSLCLKHQYENA